MARKRLPAPKSAPKNCTECACPLVLLRTDTGWTERRRICVSCAQKRKKTEKVRHKRLVEYQREYRAKNLEKARAAGREWVRKNRAAINEKRKQLRLDNPEAVRAAARAYYARRPRKSKQPTT